MPTSLPDQNHIDILLLKQQVDAHEQKIAQLEKDRKHALVAGFLTMGSAVVGLIIYIWQMTIGK